jgi:phenylacetate-CoA ligase
LIQEAEEMPDLLAISGRTDDSVTIGGTKLTEAMLDEAVACPALSDLLTGTYRAALIFERDRAILSMDLEFKPSIRADTSVLDRAYRGVDSGTRPVQLRIPTIPARGSN